MSRATSPRHSEHFPTSNKSCDLTTPVKFVIVTSCPHLLHQMLDSNSLLVSSEIAAHIAVAGPVKFGVASMLIL